MPVLASDKVPAGACPLHLQGWATDITSTATYDQRWPNFAYLLQGTIPAAVRRRVERSEAAGNALGPCHAGRGLGNPKERSSNETEPLSLAPMHSGGWSITRAWDVPNTLISRIWL